MAWYYEQKKLFLSWNNVGFVIHLSPSVWTTFVFVTHPVGMGLYGQSCVDRQDFKEKRQLTLKGVFNLGAQAGREVGDPLAQCSLCDPVVFYLGISFWVGTHPQLEQTAFLIRAISGLSIKCMLLNSCFGLSIINIWAYF